MSLFGLFCELSAWNVHTSGSMLVEIVSVKNESKYCHTECKPNMYKAFHMYDNTTIYKKR